MEAGRRERLVEIMGMAAGDESAVAALYLEFGEEIGAVIRYLVPRRGGAHLDEDDIDGLVFDACLVLARLARSWRADGGALPWTWARQRLDALVCERIGPVTTPLVREEQLGATPAPFTAVLDDGTASTTLSNLARGDERCALLLEALDAAVSPTDAEVLIRLRVQLDSGDPSPSHTVADELGLRAPAIRQRASRARRKLAEVIRTEPRYAPIADIALLDATPTRREDAA
jgi:DNA-directed RNA polymerase specialized sigma24 family protein